MGYFMQQHDIFLGTMFDQINVRFGPSQAGSIYAGGIKEMAVLQKEFEIFKHGRPLKQSIALLNLSPQNNEIKKSVLNGFANYSKHPSNLEGMNGAEAIIEAMIRNLGAETPLPVYFTSHNMQGAAENLQVKITARAQPLHYLEQDFMVISLPMQSVQAAERQRSRAKAQLAAIASAPVAEHLA